MRLVFGIILGLLVAYPSLADVVLTAAATVLVQPPVLAFAVGVALWPRISHRIRGWTA